MHRECLPDSGWRVLESLNVALQRHQAILAGGTALALHIGHRMSVDLDFFTNSEFGVESLISAIRAAGLEFRILSEGEGYFVADMEGVKFSLFHYEYPFIEDPLIYNGIHVAGVLDIASMKIIAINQRGTKRDFVDMYFILRDMPFHKVAGHMVRRFGKQRISPLVVGKALVYFSDADSNPEPEYMGEGPQWKDIKDFFKQHTKQYVLDLDSALRNEV